MVKKVLLLSATLLLVLFGMLFFGMTGETSTDTAAQLEEAVEYIDNREYEQAEVIYKTIIMDYPGTDYALEAQRKLTLMYITWDKPAQAEAAFQELLADFSEHNDIAQAVHDIADSYRGVDKYAKAGELFQYVIENWPGGEQEIWSQVGLVRSNIELGDDTAAEASIDKLLTDFTEHPEIADAVHEIADEYFSLRKYEKALELYQYVLDSWPQTEDRLWTQVAVAKSNIGLDRDLAAQAVIERVLAKFSEDPEIADAVDEIADCYRDFRKYEKALELYQYVLDNWPQTKDDLWIQVAVAKSNIGLDRDLAAQAVIERVLAKFSEDPEIADAVHDIADSYRELRKYEKARELFQYVLDNWPEDEYAMRSQAGLAELNISLGDDPNAQAAIDSLIADFNDHPDLSAALYDIAGRYETSKRYEEAKNIYQQIIQQYPGSAEAKRAKLDIPKSQILVFIDDGNDTAAQAAIDKLIADFNDQPNLSQTVFQIVEQYYHMNDYHHTIQLGERFLSEYPESPLVGEIAYFLGICYEQLENYPRAIEYYTEVMQKYPQSPNAFWVPNRLGRLYRQLGEYDRSVYWFGQQRLYSNQSLLERALYNEGLVYLLDMKEYQKAADIFWEYAELFPESEHAPAAFCNLATCYQKMGEKEPAIAMLEETLRQYPDSIFTEDIKDKLIKFQVGVGDDTILP